MNTNKLAPLSNALKPTGIMVLPKRRAASQPKADTEEARALLPALLTIRQTADVVGFSESTIRNLMRAGRFPSPDYVGGKRCVRWSCGLVQRWIEANTAQVQ